MRSLPLFLAVSSLACSSRSVVEPPPSGRDASAIVRAAIDRLGAPSRAIEAMIDTKPPVGLEVERLATELPADASAPLRIALESQPDFALSIRALGLAPSAARAVGKSSFHAGVAPGTDMFFLRAPSHLEEIRVVDAAASTTLRWTIQKSAAVAALRLREGHVEALDRAGRVRLATAPMRAVDAGGVVRALELSLTESPDGARLEAKLDGRDLRAPISIDPIWSAAASMSTARAHVVTAVLGGGKVLVAGGASASDKTSELYDPATNTWSTVGAMNSGRDNHAMVALTSGAAAGKALVVGGGTATTELFDPTTKSWSLTGSVSTSLGNPTLGTTANGSKAVWTYASYHVGPPSYPNPQVYDATLGTWKNTIGLGPDQGEPTPVELGDGRTIFMGGHWVSSVGETGLSSTMIYRPVTNDWVAGGTLAYPRGAFAAVRVGSGIVIASGFGNAPPYGAARIPQPRIEVYDIASNTSTGYGSLVAPASDAFGALLANGTIYVFDPGLVETIDPSSHALGKVTGTTPGDFDAVVQLDSSRVMVIGGGGLSNQIFSLASKGGSCSIDGDCASGHCVSGICCATACGGGAVCNPPKLGAGTCAKLDGVACSASTECDSGNCVDGVCCTTACSGQCQACNVLGSEGTCTTVIGAPKGGRAACATAAETCKQKSCDGVDALACHFPAGAKTCGAGTCTGGIEVGVGVCDGVGGCLASTRGCGAYVCGAGACKSNCASASDCVAGFFCDSASTCQPKNGLGTACDASSPCLAGLFCTDGVCCGTASCGAGSTCSTPGKLGKCTKNAGTNCTTADECATGSCVDGVCCDGACAGSCEACDVKGAEGVCSPVVGAPHGSRAPCAAGADKCADKSCDGKTRATCEGFAGSSVECRSAGCADGSITARAVCDGEGSCPAATVTSCDGFVCDASASACKTDCVDDGDCVSGFRCSVGKCTKTTDTCSGPSSVKSSDGTERACDPYACVAGACLSICTSSADCAPGLVCSPEGGCLAPATDDGSSGGCSTSGRTSSGSAIVFALVAALGMMRLRRKAVIVGAGAAIASAGCGTGSAQPSTDAGITRSAAVATPAFASARRAFSRLERRTKLESLSDRYVAHAAVEVSVPSRTGAPTTLSVDGGTLEIEPIRAGDAISGALEENAIVFAEFAPDTAVVHAAVDGGYEELRVLSSARAPTAFSWRAQVSGSFTALRLREGRLEAIDAQGKVHLAAPELIAVDGRDQSSTLPTTLVDEGAGRYRIEARLNAPAPTYPIVVDPFWSVAAPMALAARQDAATISLPDGRVMVLGGSNGSSYSATVEVYDATTNTWSSAAPMPTGRAGHSAAVVGAGASAGKIVVAGGKNFFGPVGTAAIYDLVGKTWTAIANPPTDRAISKLASASNGVFGIASFGARRRYVSWDATLGWRVPSGDPEQWDGTGSDVTLVPLANGTVLVPGGLTTGSVLITVDRYTPSTNKITAAANMHRARAYYAAALVGTKLLLVGGQEYTGSGFTPVTVGDVYDTVANTWTLTGPNLVTRFYSAAAQFGTSKVFITGGNPAVTTDELFDFSTGKYQLASTPPVAMTDVAAFALPTGAVFVRDSTNAATPVNRIYALGALGVACTFGFDCASGSCVDGVCCGSAKCAAGATCSLPGKLGTCSKPKGVSCGAAGECATGFCVDGYCCDGACTGQCESCDMPGTRGTCSPSRGAPHGARTACAGSADKCQAKICDGTLRTGCSFPPTGTICGATACKGGSETHVASCDGKGACSDTARACAPYVCGALACKTSCATSSDCAAGTFCDTVASACVPLVGLGRACSAASPCAAPAACTEGVCCESAMCASGSSCALKGHEGLCTKTAGQTCAADTECGTGACVDGVCCDSPCGGQCEACDLPGSVGTCTAVVGAPHGSRTACATGESKCENATCDGKERVRCEALPGSDVPCRTATCADGRATPAAACDGSGICPAATSASCDGYACADATACRTSCADDSGCVDGFVCSGGACKKRSSFCSEDGLSIVDVTTGSTTACAPYRCDKGACGTSCDTTALCAPGDICDTAQNKCVAPVTGGTDDGGGCAYGRGGGSSFLLLLLAASLLARRRLTSVDTSSG